MPHLHKFGVRKRTQLRMLSLLALPLPRGVCKGDGVVDRTAGLAELQDANNCPHRLVPLSGVFGCELEVEVWLATEHAV